MEPKTYTHYEYSAYNSAVNNDIERHREALLLLKAERKTSGYKNALFITLILSVIALSGALLFFILSGIGGTNLGSHSTGSIEQKRQLEKIKEAASQLTEKQQEFGVSTKFSIFTKKFTVYGDPIITAMEYLPSDLENPHWQYCYLSNEKGGLKKIIATKKGNQEIQIKVKGSELKNEALPLCAFNN